MNTNDNKENLIDNLRKTNDNLLALVNDYNYVFLYHIDKYDEEKMAIYEYSIKCYLQQIKRINTKIKKNKGGKENEDNK